MSAPKRFLKRFAAVTLCASCTLSILPASDARCQLLGLEKGEISTKASFYASSTRHTFNADGSKVGFMFNGKSVLTGVNFEILYGLTDRLTVYAAIPYVDYDLSDDAVQGIGSGFGDAVTSTNGFDGRCLETLYSVETSWEVWEKLHPSTLVLSPDNGSGRNYNYNPYKSFWDNPHEPWFVTNGMRRRIKTTLPYKEMVLGVIGPAAQKAYKFPDGMYVINDRVGGIPVAIFSDGATQSFFAFERMSGGKELTFDLAYIAEGNDLPVFKDRETLSEWTLDGIAFEGQMKGSRLPLMPSMRAFWYAWSLFFPDTDMQIVPQPG